MISVKLVSHTPDALTILLRSKGTRLKHDDDPATWPEARKMEELGYMRDTIKSSWEFVDYVFQVDGVTRAFTHQFVRTRTGSYAQQSMRSVDARDNPVEVPATIASDDFRSVIWGATVKAVLTAYSTFLDIGVPPQDARGLLPTNVTTSILAKFNLRTLHEMAQTRLCVRTQGEYQDVFRAMRAEVLAVHPWADDFLQVACVANGVCAFPRYGKTSCPVYDPAMDQTAVKARAKERFWSVRHEAVAIAKNGRTM